MRLFQNSTFVTIVIVAGAKAATAATFIGTRATDREDATSIVESLDFSIKRELETIENLVCGLDILSVFAYMICKMFMLSLSSQQTLFSEQ